MSLRPATSDQVLRTCHISFDLDGLLVPLADEFPVEPRGTLARWIGIEPLRQGACRLFRELQASGYGTHVYTTSLRPPWKIRLTLWYYGIRVGRIVTELHARPCLQALGAAVSKYPPAFGFDLHVDDSPGVRAEGRRLGFRSLAVGPDEDLRIAVLRALDG